MDVTDLIRNNEERGLQLQEEPGGADGDAARDRAALRALHQVSFASARTRAAQGARLWPVDAMRLL